MQSDYLKKMFDLSSGNRDGDEMNGNVLSVIACMYSSGFVPAFRLDL